MYDIERIIETIPEGLNCKVGESSLYLLGVSTGARSITLTNVTLSDLISVILSSEANSIILQIKYRVTKGLVNWDHIVSVEGNLNYKTNINCLYWLNQHLKKNFDLDLTNYHD